MDSLRELKSLPRNVQDQIADEFGSVEKLFKKIFDLHAESHYLNKMRPKNYLPRVIEIRDELYRVEDKLDEFGLVGYKIITRISDDLSEKEISRLASEAKIHLPQFASSSDAMKGWLKKHFEVV